MGDMVGVAFGVADGFPQSHNSICCWVWNYVTYDRSVRIILDETAPSRREETVETQSNVPEKFD